MATRVAPEQTQLLKVLKEAARLCVAVSADEGMLSIEKDGAGPVTVGDWGSQALICAALAETHPLDPVVGEEDSTRLRLPENERLVEKTLEHIQAIHPGATIDELLAWVDRGAAGGAVERFWTVDPIDGTKGYLRGDQYAIALALVVGGVVQLGGLACPNMEMEGSQGVVFLAQRGQGSWAFPLSGGDGVRLHVSQQQATEASRFCESWEKAHSAHGLSARIADRLGISREPVRMDSQAKYAAVARGDAEIYLRLPTRQDYREKIWDHAAGVIVVEEAGGRVSDINGRELDFNLGRKLLNNQGVIVSNGLLHQRVLDTISALR